MNGEPKLTQEEIKALDEEFRRQVKIIGGITEILEPRIFTLLQEHIQNARSLIIISGALATFSIAFSGSSLDKNEHFLIIGIIGLLLAVIFGIIYLNNYISKGLKSYIKKYEESTEAGKRMQDTINQFKKGEIDKDKLLEIAQQVDKEQKTEFLENKLKKKTWKSDWMMDLLTFLVAFSLFAIIISFVFPYIEQDIYLLLSKIC